MYCRVSRTNLIPEFLQRIRIFTVITQPKLVNKNNEEHNEAIRTQRQISGNYKLRKPSCVQSEIYGNVVTREKVRAREQGNSVTFLKSVSEPTLSLSCHETR